MLDVHSSLIAEILRIPGAKDAVSAALDEETAALVTDLRTAAAAGDTIKAAWTEGRLHALEGVLGILTKFSEQVTSHKE